MINERNGGIRVLFGLKLSDRLYPRPIVDTFAYLRYKYPRCTWDSLSIRKQICLWYISWMVNPDKETLSILIKKVKAWRKIDGRIGGSRSVLEKLVRRFFAKDRKKRSEAQKKSSKNTGEQALKNKTGIHAPGMKERLQDPEIVRKSIERMTLAKAQHWWVYTPDGEILEIHNLSRFCRENGLDCSHLCRTAKYPGRHHFGYRVRRRNVDLEGYTKGCEPKKGKK